jgi:hypothetical protein
MVTFNKITPDIWERLIGAKKINHTVHIRAGLYITLLLPKVLSYWVGYLVRAATANQKLGSWDMGGKQG